MKQFHHLNEEKWHLTFDELTGKHYVKAPFGVRMSAIEIVVCA